MRKSWMKSKSLSLASGKSTPSLHARSLLLAGAGIALSVSFLSAGCYVPPSNKNEGSEAPSPVSAPTVSDSPIETTEPNLVTIAEEAPTVSATITIDTPTPGWELDTYFVYQVGDELWCLHQLTPPEGPVAQMLSSTSTEFTFVPPTNTDLPLKHFVVGKTWNWNANPELTFLKTFEAIQLDLDDATLIPLRNTQ